MNNDLVFYAKKNTTDAPMMEVYIDKCIDGLPSRSTLSISTIGVKKSSEANKMWQRGVLEMINRLHPKQLLIYGGEVDFIYPEDIDVVYYENDNVKRLRGL